MEITPPYLFDAENRRNSQEDPDEAWKLQFQSVSLTSHGKCPCLSSHSFENVPCLSSWSFENVPASALAASKRATISQKALKRPVNGLNPAKRSPTGLQQS